jgi:hypothetical protein
MLRGNGLELLEGSVAYRPSSCIAVRIGVDLHHHVRNHARLRQRCWSEIHIDAHGRKIGSALQVPQGGNDGVSGCARSRPKPDSR